MSNWSDTDEALAWIETAPSRETCPAVMRALAHFARDQAEAERLWEGRGIVDGSRLPIPSSAITSAQAILEAATGNGRVEAASLFWGGKPLDRALRDLVEV